MHQCCAQHLLRTAARLHLRKFFHVMLCHVRASFCVAQCLHCARASSAFDDHERSSRGDPHIRQLATSVGSSQSWERHSSWIPLLRCYLLSTRSRWFLRLPLPVVICRPHATPLHIRHVSRNRRRGSPQTLSRRGIRCTHSCRRNFISRQTSLYIKAL
jgi:hypothetical protein